jgi:hypothetical protein
MRCFGEIFGQKKRETQIGLVGSDLSRGGERLANERRE